MKALFANEDERLWPGQFVNLALTLETLKGVLLVPAHAIQTGQKGAYVVVVKEDQPVEIRPVTPAVSANGETVAQKGLALGETIVTDGHLRLTPNCRVEIKKSLEE